MVAIGALIVGAALAVGGTAELFASRSTYNSARKDGCPNASNPDCELKASSVAQSNRASQILFVGGAVAVAGGVTLFVVAPGPAAEPRVGLGARLVF